MALFRMGVGTASQLASVAGVHRTSSYPVLQELRARGLARPVPAQTALWTRPGRDEVLSLLSAEREELLRGVQARIEAVRTLLAEVAPQAAGVTLPYVEVIATEAGVRAAYARMLAGARREFLLLDQPPCEAPAGVASDGGESGEADPAIIEPLARGVSIRVLYERARWERADAAPFRAAMAAYVRAGVRGRLVEALPMRMALADRSVAVFALAAAVPAEVGAPLHVLVDHAGYGAFQAEGFDARWASAQVMGTPGVLPQLGQPL